MFIKNLLKKILFKPPPIISQIIEDLSVIKFRSDLINSNPSTIPEFVDFSLSFNIFPSLLAFIIEKFLINETIKSSYYLIMSIRPIQIKEEIIEFLDHMKKINPSIVLELGTANGGTFFLF